MIRIQKTPYPGRKFVLLPSDILLFIDLECDLEFLEREFRRSS